MSSKLPPGKIVYHHSDGTRILRPLHIEDTPAIYRARVESQDSLKQFMLWAHFPNSFIDQHNWVASSIFDYLKGMHHMTLGFFDTKNQLIGIGSWKITNHLNPQAIELGFWIAQPFQNKGWCTIMTKLLVVGAFEWLQAKRVQAMVHPANRPSLRVIEKCGFQYETLVRNYLTPPTEDMIANGLDTCTDALQFSLINTNLNLLPWYPEVISKTTITPLYPELITYHTGA